MNGRIALSAFFALAWVVQARSASLGLGAVVLEPGVAVDVVAESISPEEVTRDKREPGAILGLLGGHGHHHGHHGAHHGGGGGGGGSGAGSFASASAGSGSFNNNLGGYGGSGSQASANSQSASYSFGPFSASFSSSQANAGSQSQSGGGLFDFF